MLCIGPAYWSWWVGGTSAKKTTLLSFGVKEVQDNFIYGPFSTEKIDKDFEKFGNTLRY